TNDILIGEDTFECLCFIEWEISLPLHSNRVLPFFFGAPRVVVRLIQGLSQAGSICDAKQMDRLRRLRHHAIPDVALSLLVGHDLSADLQLLQRAAVPW